MVYDLCSTFNHVRNLAHYNNQILLGQEGGSNIALPSLAPTAHKLSADNPNSEAAKEKSHRTFMEIIEAANAYIEQLRKDIEDMERGFRERDGDAWREKLALKILDADDIPLRRSDESMDDYRERLESILIAQMLNENGSIKKQYSDDKHLYVYAQWAQKKYNFNVANGYVQELENLNTPPERKEEIYEELKQNPNIEKLTHADQAAATESDVQSNIKDIADDAYETNLNTKSDVSERSALFKPIT